MAVPVSSEDRVNEKYYDLLRLQRRVNKTLDIHAGEAATALKEAEEGLAREVDRMIREDADASLFHAIEAAAQEVPDAAGFIRLAKETEAKVLLRYLSKEHGAPPAFRQSIQDSEHAIGEKEERLKALEANVAKLEKQLQPVRDHNSKNHMNINEANREAIEGAGFFAKLNNEYLSEACSVTSAYASAHATWNGQNKVYGNCFDDIKRLNAAKKEIEGLGPEIGFLYDQHYRRLGAYREMRDVQRTLADLGADEKKPADMAGFQQELCKRLRDPAFLTALSRHLPAGAGGDTVLAALGVMLRQDIVSNLENYRKQVRETTALLEGPIGTIAKATRVEDAIEGIGTDIRAQGVMAGYLCISAAEALKSIAAFRPEHKEGPASLRRDLLMHMATGGQVDPAYIHEVFRMDNALTRIFNVNAAQPMPRFSEILASPVSVERVDRHYASFLKKNADNEDINAAGFAAGQFDVISFEQFLGRYFPAGTTYDQLAAALENEAAEIEKVEDQREKMGIRRGGPRLPDLGAK